MAISKTQPMRSAEIDLVDGFNQLESDVADEIIARSDADAALGSRIDDEILARQDADTALGGRISDEAGARANADTEIMNIIGSGFSSLNTVKSNVDELKGFDGRFRIGMTQAYTIAASGTQAVSVDFNTPYESTDEILVLVNPIGANESFTDLKCVLDSAGYVGFSATIENSDTVNSYTVALGFIAVKVN